MDLQQRGAAGDEQKQQPNILMVNSTSINIYKMRPSLDKTSKPGSQMTLRQAKQLNNQLLQTPLRTNNIQNQKESAHSVSHHKYVKSDQSSHFNTSSNFRISQSALKPFKTNIAAEQPQQNSNQQLKNKTSTLPFKTTVDATRVNSESILKKDLRTMIGLSYQAAHGFENICEHAYTKSKMDQLKLNTLTSQKLVNALKDEVQKQSKLEFQQSYSQKQQSSFFNGESTPQKERNQSTQAQQEGSTFSKMVQAGNNFLRSGEQENNKLNKSDVGIANTISLDSKFSQMQQKLNTQGGKRQGTNRRMHFSQQMDRNKIIGKTSDISQYTQMISGIQTENIPLSRRKSQGLYDGQGSKAVSYKNNNDTHNNTMNNTNTDMGFSSYSQNKMAAMISRDNSNIVNQSLQLMNSMRKRNNLIDEERSPQSKFRTTHKQQSQVSTQNHSRPPSQQYDRNPISPFSMNAFNQNTTTFEQHVQMKSPSDLEQTEINSGNTSQMQRGIFKQQHPKSTPLLQNSKMNPHQQILVNQFLKEKKIDSKNWPKLREKIYYTLQMKSYTTLSDQQQNINNSTNKIASNNKGLDEIKESHQTNQKNDNQIQLFQQNLFNSFFEQKEGGDNSNNINTITNTNNGNNLQQPRIIQQPSTKNTILPSTKNSIDYNNTLLSFKKGLSQNRNEITGREDQQTHQKLDSQSQLTSVNQRNKNKSQGNSNKNAGNQQQAMSFNDQFQRVVNQAQSLENTPKGRKSQQLQQNQNSNDFYQLQSGNTPNSQQTKKKQVFKLDFDKLNNKNSNNNSNNNKQETKKSSLKPVYINERKQNEYKAFSARNFSSTDLLQTVSENKQQQQQKQITPRKDQALKSARYSNDITQANHEMTPINSSYFQGSNQITGDQQKTHNNNNGHLPSKIYFNDTTPTANKVKKSVSLLSSAKVNASQGKPTFQDKVKSYNEMNFINRLNSVYDSASQGSPSHSQQHNQDKSQNQSSFMNATSKSNFSKKHVIMNSLCLIQLKKIKEKVTEVEKQRLQNFFDDITQTQNMLKYQKDTPIEEIAPDYKLHQIKYIPRGNQEIFENVNLKKVFKKGMRDLSPQKIVSLSALQQEEHENEEYKQAVVLLNTQKEYNKDKKIVYTKEQDLKQELKDMIEEKANKADNKIPSQVKFTAQDLISPKTKKNFDLSLKNRSKWQSMRKDLIEFLEKINKLNIPMDEVVDNKLFTRLPYHRTGAQEFFEHVKSNNYKAVIQFLETDKYLVYCYDTGMNTPLQWACKRGNKEIAQKLIEYNSDLDHTNLLKKTALYYACSKGDQETAVLLLKNRANPWSKGKCSLNQFIWNFDQNIDYFNAAKRIHFMMTLVPMSKKSRIWEEFSYLFTNK